MGIIERKQREKAERRALIMGCAKELILEYGVEEVKIHAIAEKCELSKGTIYLYFTNRDILFQEICDEAGLQFIEHFQSQVRPDISALDMFKLLWSSFIDLFGKSVELVLLFQMRRYVIPDYPFISLEERKSSSNHSYAIFSMIKDMIERGIREGVFDPEINPVIISHTVLSLFAMIMKNAGKVDANENSLEAVLIFKQMQSVFQTLLRGFIREGVDPASLTLGMPASLDRHEPDAGGCPV